MAPKLPTIMTPHVPLIARPVVHVDEDGGLYIESSGPGVQCLTLIPDPSGALIVGLRHRLAPATSAVLLTKAEAAEQIYAALDALTGMKLSAKARRSVEYVIEEWKA